MSVCTVRSCSSTLQVHSRVSTLLLSRAVSHGLQGRRRPSVILCFYRPSTGCLQSWGPYRIHFPLVLVLVLILEPTISPVSSLPSCKLQLALVLTDRQTDHRPSDRPFPCSFLNINIPTSRYIYLRSQPSSCWLCEPRYTCLSIYYFPSNPVVCSFACNR